MGFIDRLDDAITTARAHHGAHREARAFSRSVTLGTTYYATVRHTTGQGEVKLLHEFVFTTTNPITGTPMSGHRSAEQLWLTHGPLTSKRPSRLPTLNEHERGRLPEYAAARR